MKNLISSLKERTDIYCSTNNGFLLQGDCLEKLKLIPDKSINLICLDPPYNINKADWDTWKTVTEYVEFMGEVFKECERVLKDNGSFYFFHNDFMQMVELQYWLNKNSNFIFKQLIVWNKKFKGAKNEGFLQGFIEPKMLRNYQKMAEYCLYYTFQGKFIETPYSKVIKKQMKELNLKEMDFRKLKISKNGNPTGWCSNIIKGKNIPTESDWELICKLIGEYSYESLLQEYENLRYTFNNQKTHHSVWNYEIAKKRGHCTPKPLDLIKNIILYSSNENATVLDCFSGSGTLAVACEELHRKWICIEKEEKYCEITKERLINIII
ncbi:MAG TPA: site-specific DNA-methyltransferase [Clostridium sp.]|uniref:DNA-methyltransferase n=1 Tax=Clostridium sp. TaxID=1506 RepID=UPI002F926ACA